MGVKRLTETEYFYTPRPTMPDKGRLTLRVYTFSWGLPAILGWRRLRHNPKQT